MKISKILLCLGALLATTSAYAATQSLTATARFVTPLTLTKIKDLDFGVLMPKRAATYTLNTAGVVSTNTGLILSGPSQAGEMLIKGKSNQTIDINAGNFGTNQGVSIIAVRCKYDVAAEANCNMTNQPAPGAAGKTLLIGARILVNGTQAPSVVAVPTFDITVNYH